MVGHVFKKDCRLLWPLAIALVALEAIRETLTFKLGLFHDDMMLEQLVGLTKLLLGFGWVFTMALAVFHEAIPGVRQDWLARPIRRRDLLAAKFLFAAAFVLAPIFAAALFDGLARGFGWWVTLGPAVIETVRIGVVLVLPVIAIASLLKNITQGIVASVVIVGCLLVASSLMALALRGRVLPRIFTVSGAGGALTWMVATLILLVTCGGAAAILALQYRKRRTVMARCMVAVVFVLVLVAQLLPWDLAFGVEKRLSAKPGAGQDVAIAFKPSLGRYTRPSAEGAPRYQGAIFLPMKITGTPGRSVLVVDRAYAGLAHVNGATLDSIGAHMWNIWREDQGVGEDDQYVQVTLPRPVYQAEESHNLTVNVNFSLTLFQYDSTFSVPLSGGGRLRPDGGWCETRIDPFGKSVRLACMKPGGVPTCTSSFLQDTQIGEQAVTAKSCRANYAPAFMNDDPMGSGNWFLSMLPDADPAHMQFVVRIYKPVDHFTRHVLIPKIKLADWTPR